MRVARDGPEDGPPLVCIMGWGNKLEHGNVQWLREQFADAGYRTHTFQVQEVVGDFDQEYVVPVQEYVDDLEEFRLVGHSTGALIGTFVDGATTRTYLSPWFGFPSGPIGLDKLLLSLLARIPTTRKILPSGTGDPDDIGELATEGQFENASAWAAPTFFREGIKAHRERPPVDDDAVVFCTPSDQVVSIPAVGEAVSTEQMVLYDGGHEWFSSPPREEQLDTLLAAVEDGLDGLH